MILTGSQIIKEQNKRKIKISPFEIKNVNPNSYNYRLGRYLKIINGDQEISETIDLSQYPNGYVLTTETLYLGSTYECIGSDYYAMSLIGRSSIGRYGLFMQISANLGHTGSKHCWTLEILATLPIKVYYKMKIGQVSFWKNRGEIIKTKHHYNNFNIPKESMMSNDFDR